MVNSVNISTIHATQTHVKTALLATAIKAATNVVVIQISLVKTAKNQSTTVITTTVHQVQLVTACSILIFAYVQKVVLVNVVNSPWINVLTASAKMVNV